MAGEVDSFQLSGHFSRTSTGAMTSMTSDLFDNQLAGNHIGNQLVVFGKMLRH